MPDFQYIARGATGQQVTGVLNAPSKQAALGTLSSQELFPVSIEPILQAQTRLLSFKSRIRSQKLTTFYTQLADLLESGVPLLRSLELLEKQAKAHAFHEVTQDVRERVADGSRLADALKLHSNVFGELSINMVRAGEEGGFLEDVLRRTAGFLEHQEEIKSRVFGAVVYPVFLMVAMFLVLVVMLVYFIPKFEPVFSRLSEQGELPWATTFLMTASSYTQSMWIVGVLLAATTTALLLNWLKTESGRRKFDAFRIGLPGLGAIVRSLAISRFCRILGTLLKNGVPILASLHIAKNATGNLLLKEAIGNAADHVSEGRSLAGPLSASGEFSDEIIEMISVGEEANNLEQVLVNVADSMEKRTNRQIDLMVRLLEPVLLTVMAGLVLFIVVSLLLPILQSSAIF